MGNTLRRVSTNFNVESRAHRLIDKDKIRKSPLHPTTIKKMKELESRTSAEDTTALQDRLHRKDSRLLGMLQDVKVQSTDPVPKNPDVEAEAPSKVFKTQRLLPQDRKPIPQPTSVLESQQVEIVPPGRLSVYLAQELLVKNKQNPTEYNAERLAKDYKLDLTDTQNVIEYFKTLKIVPMLSSEAVEKLREAEMEKEALKVMNKGQKVQIDASPDVKST